MLFQPQGVFALLSPQPLEGFHLVASCVPLPILLSGHHFEMQGHHHWHPAERTETTAGQLGPQGVNGASEGF